MQAERLIRFLRASAADHPQAAGAFLLPKELPVPPVLPTYLSLGAFYASDARRDASHETDVGLWWRGDAHQAPVFRAAYVVATGELYLMQLEGLPGGGRIDVVARFPDHATLEQALAGWEDVCGDPGSLRWLLERVPGEHPPHLLRAAQPASAGERGRASAA
jgi:hypothetical protein